MGSPRSKVSLGWRAWSPARVQSATHPSFTPKGRACHFKGAQTRPPKGKICKFYRRLNRDHLMP